LYMIHMGTAISLKNRELQYEHGWCKEITGFDSSQYSTELDANISSLSFPQSGWVRR
jgi:hypothetical protein